MGIAQEQEQQNPLDHIKAVSAFYRLIKTKSQKANWNQIVDQINLFRSEFERLEQEKKVPLPILTNILKQTTALLNGGISNQQYINFSEKISKKSPHGLQVLGGIMMVLGILSLIAAIAISFVIPPLTPILAGSGVGLILGGYGLFKQQHDLPKAMTSLAKACSKLESEETVFEEKLEELGVTQSNS